MAGRHYEALQHFLTLLDRLLDHRATVEIEQVEGDESHRKGLGGTLDVVFVLKVDAALQQLEGGNPVLQRYDLAVDDRLKSNQLLVQASGLWIGIGDISALAGQQPGFIRADRERPHAIPLRLEDEAFVVERLLDKRGQHRGQKRRLLGGRSLVATQERKPLVVVGVVEVVDALKPLAVKAEAELAPFLLEHLIGARIEDADLPGAVVALGDRAFEAAVVEGVVLDVDGEVGLSLLRREVFRHRPRHQDRDLAVEHFEPQVEVQTAGVMLMDDERPSGRSRGEVDVARDRGGGLGSCFEAAFVGVVAGLVHWTIVGLSLGSPEQVKGELHRLRPPAALDILVFHVDVQVEVVSLAGTVEARDPEPASVEAHTS